LGVAVRTNMGQKDRLGLPTGVGKRGEEKGIDGFSGKEGETSA